MQTGMNTVEPLAVRMAELLNRGLTWGMPPKERRELLTETQADWHAMHEQQGSVPVMLRAVRGIPAAIWVRMDDRDLTALPAALAIGLLGMAGIAGGLVVTGYPTPLRVFTLVLAVGMLLTGVLLTQQPRRIVVRRYFVPALLLSVGFTGMAFNIPPVEAWPYDTPVIYHPLLDGSIAVGFFIAGAGFALVALGAFVRGRSLLRGAWALVTLGTTVFGVAQIIWGVLAARTDLTITVSSVAGGLASLSFVHVVPRLRHLEIVQDSRDTQ